MTLNANYGQQHVLAHLPALTAPSTFARASWAVPAGRCASMRQRLHASAGVPRPYACASVDCVLGSRRRWGGRMNGCCSPSMSGSPQPAAMCAAKSCIRTGHPHRIRLRVACTKSGQCSQGTKVSAWKVTWDLGTSPHSIIRCYPQLGRQTGDGDV